MTGARQYAEGRVHTLSLALAASGLSVRALAKGAGVSRQTAQRAIDGQGIQAYNYFLIEYYIMHYTEQEQNKALVRAAQRMTDRMAARRIMERQARQQKESGKR